VCHLQIIPYELYGICHKYIADISARLDYDWTEFQGRWSLWDRGDTSPIFGLGDIPIIWGVQSSHATRRNVELWILCNVGLLFVRIVPFNHKAVMVKIRCIFQLTLAVDFMEFYLTKTHILRWQRSFRDLPMDPAEGLCHVREEDRRLWLIWLNLPKDRYSNSLILPICGSNSSRNHAESQPVFPFPSNRHHRSNGDCLQCKRENYQVCSVQYCVQQLYTVNCTHIWTELTVLWIEFCLTGPISLCLDSFLCRSMYYFFVWLYIACMCSTVTWWGGPDGIEAWSLGPLLPSVLWHCWLGHLTHKNPSPIWPIMCLVGR